MRRPPSFKTVLLLFAALCAGALYYWVTDVRIEGAELLEDNGKTQSVRLPFEYSHAGKKDYRYRIRLASAVPQRKLFHIVADDEIADLRLNGKAVDLEKVRRQYGQKKLKDYRQGYVFGLELKRGTNELEVTVRNYGLGTTLKLYPRIGYLDYALLFLLWMVPLILIGVRALESLLPVIERHAGRFAPAGFFSVRTLPLWIIAGGIALRVVYVTVYGYTSYQHDRSFHVEFIRYFADNWSIPLPDKALEFPQQPLYYFITGKLYWLGSRLGFGENDVLYFIATLSTLMMSVQLVVAYRAVRLLSGSPFVVNTVLAFLAFTPAFVFQAAQINNDVLNYFLATFALYYIIAYYREATARRFYAALFFSALVFLTKVSAGMVSIALFAVLLQKYFQARRERAPQGTETVRGQITVFAAVILFLFGFSLLRVYLPATGEFLFVKSGVFPGQAIRHLGASYFLTFNLPDLVREGQAYVYDKHFMPVKQSFFTWQYATMLLGEYDYKRVFSDLYLNRAVYLLGTVYVAGLAGFVLFFRKMPYLLKVFGMLVVLNEILIARFAIAYPSVCNTDFRYNTPTFFLWALLFAFGLEAFRERHAVVRKLIAAGVVAVSAAEILWLIQLLWIAKKNTIT